MNPDGIEIGLVNNMPGAALEATERQFRALLEAAADGMPVRLSLFAMPGVPRSEEGRRRIETCYRSFDDLRNTRLDGLIVTGAEPLAAELRDEPFWTSLEELVAWADRNTSSSVWSCLAAHAAVLQMDGIRRRPLREKLCGVFACTKAVDDPLMSGLPTHLQVPHSRWNDLPEGALAAAGYCILTRSEVAGVDAFVKTRNSLFVFFQGHPEYEANTLLLEYRRDARRFLRRETNVSPVLPTGCDDNAEALNTWRPEAVAIYRNWLRYLRAQKEHRQSHAAYQQASA